MRKAVSLVLAAFVVVVSGFFAPPAAAATQQVMMQGYAFSPAALTVHSGDTVTWTQHDTAPHNVVTTSAPVALHSPELSQGQTWSYTFSTPGTYSYYCTVHPDMRATVTVLAAPTTAKQVVPVTGAPVTSKRAATTAPTRAPAVSSSAGAPAAAMSSMAPPSTEVAATPTTAAPIATQAEQAPTTTLDPMLLVAGVVTAVAVFCLLLLGARRA
jgi:plastocyanin